MDILYFVVKYIPFWAVPLAFIGINFGVYHWQKGMEKSSLVFFIGVGCCFLFLVYWILTGGPEGSVQFIQSFFI